MSDKIYAEDLIVKLGANETFEVRTTQGRTLMRVTMAADEQSVVGETVAITQYDAGTDIGNTGYILSGG